MCFSSRSVLYRSGWYPPLAAGLLGCLASALLMPLCRAAAPPDDAPQAIAEAAAEEDTAAEETAAEETAAEPLGETQLAEIIDRLGSPRFAQREDAIARARQAGVAILPALSRAAKQHPDAEVRSRARYVYERIVANSFDARAEAFLAGEDLGETLAGWQYVASLMGDNPSVRELFVATSRRYPELMESFQGSSRDQARRRTLAVERVVQQILHKMRDLHQVPTAEDVMAALWGIADPNVLIADQTQALVLSLLRKAAANELRQDAQLGDAFLRLVGRWLRRSPVNGARHALGLALQWDLRAEGRVLGMRAAYEARDLADVHAGLQAVARFGTTSDVPYVLPFWDDLRPLPLPGAEPAMEVRTADVAMATVAKLYGLSLREVGFPEAVEHPKTAFSIETLGFPKADPEVRKAVQQRLREEMKTHGHVLDPEVPPAP